MKIAAIMQPSYLPWIGYFDLIDQSDIFVFLDSVQFNKRSWQQRNRIKTPKGELMLTVPVLTKDKRDQCILDVGFDLTQTFKKKHLKTIKHNYSIAPFFSVYYDSLTSIFEQNYKYLAEFNIALIKWFSKKLGINVKFIRSSSLEVSGKKVALLVNICKILGIEHYLSPIGSKEYLENNSLFVKNGINLYYQNFKHPIYGQLYGEFIPYMSTIDLLFNEGLKSMDIVRSGRQYNKLEE